MASSLDDVTEELKKLVDLSTAQSDVQKAIFTLMTLGPNGPGGKSEDIIFDTSSDLSDRMDPGLWAKLLRDALGDILRTESGLPREAPPARRPDDLAPPWLSMMVDALERPRREAEAPPPYEPVSKEKPAYEVVEGRALLPPTPPTEGAPPPREPRREERVDPYNFEGGGVKEYLKWLFSDLPGRKYGSDTGPSRMRRVGAALGRTMRKSVSLGGRIGGAVGRVAGMALGGAVGAVAGKPAAGAALGAAALGAAAGAAGVALGAVAGAATAVGAAFKTAVGAVESWTDSALANAKRFEDSGPMTAVFAEKEVRDLMRNIERGDKTAGTAHDLMEAEAARKDALMPLMVFFDNTINKILTFLNEIIVPVIELVTSVIKAIYEAIRELIKIITDALPGVDVIDIGPFAPPGDDDDARGPAIGLGADAAVIGGEAARMDRVGWDLLARARAAAAAARMGGVVAPGGAMPPFAVPG